MASDDRRIAFLATGVLKEADLLRFIEALEETGLCVDLVAATSHSRNGSKLLSDAFAPDDISPADYSALALPASAMQDDSLHQDAASRRLVQSMQAAGKPILYVPPPPVTRDPKPLVPPPFNLKRLLADSWQHWNDINAPRMGAALAYYGLLSTAPLFVLVVSLTGIFFKRTIIQTGLLWQVQEVIGNAGSSIVTSILDNAKVSTGILAATLGIVMLFLGASGVFLELRDSLDTVWGVKPRYGSGMVSLLRARASAFLTVLGTGIVMSSLILLSVIVSTRARFLLHIFPAQGVLAGTFEVLLSTISMTFVFALIYKAIPDIRIRWNDVWIGALVTSILFTLGKLIIGVYLAKAGIGSPYAAAGSLVIFLTWVYYSAQIFLFGAGFTHIYALRHGSYSKPGKRPKSVAPEDK